MTDTQRLIKALNWLFKHKDDKKQFYEIVREFKNSHDVMQNHAVMIAGHIYGVKVEEK